MRRRLLWSALALLGVGGLALGLFWARPDWLADLKRLGVRAASTPEVPPEPVEPPKVLEQVDDGWCTLHQRPESLCDLCPSLAPAEGPRVCLQTLPILELATPDVARQIGLETSKTVSRPHARTIAGNAEIVYNANAYAEITPRVAGIIREILTDEGHLHKKGDVLIEIDSAEVGSAKAAYLTARPLVDLARATLDRTRALTRENALPLKDELEAQAAFNTATADLLNAAQRLRNLGFNDDDLTRIAETRDTSSLLKIPTPIDGTVVSRHAVTGEAVLGTTQIFVVADLRMMWAWIDIYETDIEYVKAGQVVQFRIGGFEERVFPGHVDWIDAAVNPTTRTIRVRAEIGNPEGRLRSNQFGQAEIIVGEEHEAVFVSRQAIQQLDGVPLVFLRLPDGRFRPQRVLLDDVDTMGDEVEVTWGLKADQEVVTTGSFLIRSDLERELGYNQ